MNAESYHWTTSSSQGDSSIKTRYGSRMLTPWNLITTPKNLEWKLPSFPLLFSVGFPHVNYLLLFHMKLWFPWCICISKLQFSIFLWMCFRKPLSLLGAKHKKAAATRPIKKRWDGLLLCLVHAGFSKKCKEERALRRHYPCFKSLASKTPYTLYDYVRLIWTKFTRCWLKAPW